MYSFQEIDFATEILLDEVFAFDEFEQEFELDDEMPDDEMNEDAGMEGYLFGWDSQSYRPSGSPQKFSKILLRNTQNVTEIVRPLW